jgi:hypothetical protein
MTETSLQHFLDTVHANQNANRINFAHWYQIIDLIDVCFVRAGKNLINPKPVITGNLLLRCQYAFKTAAGLALAGQMVEAFVMQRSVLEYAGYCLKIYDTPALEDVFLSRHVGTKEMKAQREAFQIGPVRNAIERYDAMLAGHFNLLYQRSVNFGAHPNPHAIIGITALDERGNETGVMVVAISNDSQIIKFVLKSTAQVGLTALCILQHVFREKFELLGIRQEIDALKNTGLL